MTGQLMTRLGYSPAASRSEQVRWLVSRCEPFLLVMLSVHYLVRTSVWPVSIPVLIASIAGLALGLFGAVYPTNSRLGVLRATVATLLLIAMSLVLSHHLVVYHDDTGRDVIKDREATTRAIEFKAKLGKPTLDQPRLPLAGPNKYLGQHFPIPEGMKAEVKPAEEVPQ